MIGKSGIKVYAQEGQDQIFKNKAGAVYTTEFTIRVLH
jgi:hypothetical protein